MAKAKEVLEQTEPIESGKCLIKTADVGLGGVSERLQKHGQKVVAISGGIIGDIKVHYFRMSLKQAQALKNKSKEPLLKETDLELIEEVKSITPSKVIDTGLKERLMGGNKVTKLNE